VFRRERSVMRYKGGNQKKVGGKKFLDVIGQEPWGPNPTSKTPSIYFCLQKKQKRKKGSIRMNSVHNPGAWTYGGERAERVSLESNFPFDLLEMEITMAKAVRKEKKGEKSGLIW